jgi:hypothetical protein
MVNTPALKKKNDDRNSNVNKKLVKMSLIFWFILHFITTIVYSICFFPKLKG